jgi:hypothetical protein
VFIVYGRKRYLPVGMGVTIVKRYHVKNNKPSENADISEKMMQRDRRLPINLANGC